MHGIINIPNSLTIFRILLIPPFLYFIRGGTFLPALVILFVASFTDLFDGVMARRLNQQTSFGRILDPLADKLLTTCTFLAMAFPQPGIPSIPKWLAISVVTRDVIILAGAGALYLRSGYTGFKPLTAGRINTGFEMGFILFFLAINITQIGMRIIPALAVMVLTTVIISGISYVILGIRLWGQRSE